MQVQMTVFDTTVLHSDILIIIVVTKPFIKLMFINANTLTNYIWTPYIKSLQLVEKFGAFGVAMEKIMFNTFTVAYHSNCSRIHS